MGEVPMWDVSKVRPAGARLKIFGGRASGHTSVDLFNFTVSLFKQMRDVNYLATTAII